MERDIIDKPVVSIRQYFPHHGFNFDKWYEGVVDGHPKHKDGTRGATSRVIAEDSEGFETLNTVYKFIH